MLSTPESPHKARAVRYISEVSLSLSLFLCLLRNVMQDSAAAM